MIATAVFMVLILIHSKVKVLFTFTKAGGNRSEEDTKKLLQVTIIHLSCLFTKTSNC